ncbi:sensor histidine kinase [Rhizobium ruizarguesonis]|uniref:sensor histidine kinase n=1 Tax=Rhizobium ruizarguesonis TaxID=2081791 RepID=UPI00103076ED|nr:histidine kinase dimerization/phosphoacceptor domain -containing protein [Rhizobium ruizarguesonis]NEI97700.1 sensor histidine kinase [Rhizobium ruizarguesonis]NEJ34239.1 sensor histidine kinase [Rhizobium ruizarguesonis]TBA34040.1 sensor histidine kinase [Rhizobium ruizarguesonis]
MIGGDKYVGSVGKASLAIIALMFLSLTTLLSLWLISSYETAVRRGDERVSAASKIVAANANWLNSLARETLHRIDDALGPSTSLPGPDRVRDLDAAVYDLPPQATAYIIGADGETLYSNDRNIRPINVTDRDYFVRLRNGADEYTSPLIISRLSQRQIFVFSRRLERNGVFAGVAVIAFDASILRPIWDAVAIGENSIVSLIRRDGQLIARYPEPAGPVDMRNHKLFTDYMRKATSGTYRSVSPVDNEDRLVGYRILERTPFVAIASADIHVIMQPFWEDAKIAALLVAFALVGALAAALWIQNLIKVDTLHTRQLADALRSNETLMREIHHRVKNNLQTVMALLRLQGFEPEAVQKLNERISAMSAVHEQMYGFDQFSGISAREFIPSFVRTLVDVHGRAVSVDFEIDDIVIAADKATPFALLLNELIANSMKYAFDGRASGNIRVMLRMTDGEESQLTVADDGIGFDGRSDSAGMGTRLIKAFVNQLHGEARYNRLEGTQFRATLKLTD